MNLWYPRPWTTETTQRREGDRNLVVFSVHCAQGRFLYYLIRSSWAP